MKTFGNRQGVEGTGSENTRSRGGQTDQLASSRVFESEQMRCSRPTAQGASTSCGSRAVRVRPTENSTGTSGLELLKAVREVAPDTEVVVMTAYGTVETAVQAMRDGAYDFVEKPLKRMTIVKSVRKAAERQSLVVENRSLRQELKLLTTREIVGQSGALRRVLDVATQAAPSSATVLILGESGTGKELLARLVHGKSGRASGRSWRTARPSRKAFSKPSCWARGGAFTGAVNRREGRFAKAWGAPCFGRNRRAEPRRAGEDPACAAGGWYEPVGGNTVKSDARIIAATNRDLTAEVEAGRFREDLYYRLNVIALTAPPLRSRREDIPLLVDHFLGVYCRKNGRARLSVPREVLTRLSDYAWPGNVRELENVVERAAVLCRGDVLRIEDLPDAVAQATAPAPSALTFAIGTPLDEVEMRMIRRR